MTNLHSLLVSAERLFLLFENINRAVYMWQVKGLFLMRQNILHLRIEYTCWKRDLSIDSTKEPLALEGLQLNCHGSSPSSPPNRPRPRGRKSAQMRQKWVFVYVVQSPWQYNLCRICGEDLRGRLLHLHLHKEGEKVKKTHFHLMFTFSQIQVETSL